MPPRLSVDPDLLEIAVARASDVLSIPQEHVEKDFWLTEALRGAAHSAAEVQVPLFFKGGTSLSKVHRIIRRFSEDVDLLVVLDHSESANLRNYQLKYICAGAAKQMGATNPQTVPDSTAKGVKRAVILPYSQVHSANGLRPNGVLLEVGWWGGTLPSSSHAVRSLIAEVTDQIGLDSFEEAVPVSVKVLSPVRTTVEKLAIVHAASVDTDEQRRASIARHYYDLWCLLTSKVVGNRLMDPDHVAALAHDVYAHSQLANVIGRPRPRTGYRSSEAFDSSRSELSITREAFDGQVRRDLIWPDADCPEFDEICAVVRSFPAPL